MIRVSVIEIHKNEWPEHNFNGNNALKVIDISEGGEMRPILESAKHILYLLDGLGGLLGEVPHDARAFDLR